MSQPKIQTDVVKKVDQVHLDFGLRGGTTAEGNLFIYRINLPQVNTFPGVEKPGYQKFLAPYGIRMIGHEEVTVEKSIPDSYWRFFYSNMNVDSENIDFISSGLRNSLLKEGKVSEVNLAENVTFSLRAMILRLRDISISYADQASRAVAQGVKPGLRFENQQTLDLFLNIHSFLVETATLRDHLAAFLSAIVFEQPDIRKMAKLVRYLEKFSSSLPIAAKILEVCDGASAQGWLARLSSLRNLVVHSAPISSLGDRLGMKAKRCIISDAELLGVSFEVPEDSLLQPSGARIDALRLCVQIARNMIDLFREIVRVTGVKPTLMRFSDADLL